MYYIEHNLLENEKLIYAVRPHWVVFTSTLWSLLLAIYVGFFAHFSILNADLYMGYGIGSILAAVLLLISVYWFFQALIFYLNAEYGVTDKRVLIKVGWIHRESLELMLDKVEGVLVDQTILGRIFGYGVITIVGTGGTKDSYPFIPHPLRFRKSVQQAVENMLEKYQIRVGQ